MSVRAHRILKVDYAPETSFNVWHDEKLVEFLDRENDLGFYNQMNDNGGGVVSLTVEVLQKVVDQAKELELDDDTVRVLREDIASADPDETIDYDCF